MYKIGQVFKDKYPPESAVWCNKNGCKIEKQGRDYVIVAIPEPTAEELAEIRKAEILARLSAIDLESLRPLRAIAQGVVTDYDSEKLATLEAEAVELRAELASL